MLETKNTQSSYLHISASLHAGEHYTLSFLHVHLLLLQSVWQLLLTILRISSGDGGTSVCAVFLHSFPIPILLAEVHSLSTPISESRHGGYGTLEQLKWVVEFADEKSKVIGIIISDLHIITNVK